MSSELSDGLRAGIRAARISTAMHGLSPEIANELPPEDWPEVLSRLQSTYRRVTGQPDAVLALRTPSKEGDGWVEVAIVKAALPFKETFSAREVVVPSLTQKKIYNSLTYLCRSGDLAHIGYGRYQRPPDFERRLQSLGDRNAPPVPDTRSTGE